jgi:hypothetical protein
MTNNLNDMNGNDVIASLKPKRKKYRVFSPDGFTIEFDVVYYKSKKKSMEAFNQWKKRYETQGYYSSAKYGRIPLEDLEDYCQFVTS